MRIAGARGREPPCSLHADDRVCVLSSPLSRSEVIKLDVHAVFGMSGLGQRRIGAIADGP